MSSERPTAEIVALGDAPISSDRRREFLEHVAAAFDNFVAERGEEPDAIVVSMLGLRQPPRATHLVQGDSRGAATALLALAATDILGDLWRTD